MGDLVINKVAIGSALQKTRGMDCWLTIVNRQLKVKV